MIFGFLVRALKFIVDGFASVCAFLLVTLGLWLPAVYSLLFLVVCAIAGIKLQGVVITFYIIGLVITFSGAVGISYIRYNAKRKSKKRSARNAQANVRSVKKSEFAPRDYESGYDAREYDAQKYEPQGYETREFTQAQDGIYSQSAVSGQTAPTDAQQPLPNTEQPAEKQNAVSAAKSELYGKNDYKYEDFSDLRKKYFGDGNEADVTPSESCLRPYSQGGEFVPPTNPDALMREQLERRLMGTFSEEQPMVFATRRDPNIIVYQYSDRLKFFTKTKRGLVHISTEYKK